MLTGHTDYGKESALPSEGDGTQDSVLRRTVSENCGQRNH